MTIPLYHSDTSWCSGGFVSTAPPTKVSILNNITAKSTGYMVSDRLKHHYLQNLDQDKEDYKRSHTSMIAAWTRGFWKATATSGLAIIFPTTSSGVSPICSAKHRIRSKTLTQGTIGSSKSVQNKDWRFHVQTHANSMEERAGRRIE